MIAFDDGPWPLVAVTRGSDFTIADATAQIIAFDNMLRRREPFALLITHEDGAFAANQSDDGANGMASRWLEANRELLQRWCRGIAIVAPSSAGGEDGDEPLAAIGSPVSHFADVASAEAWLMERLAG